MKRHNTYLATTIDLEDLERIFGLGQISCSVNSITRKIIIAGLRPGLPDQYVGQSMPVVKCRMSLDEDDDGKLFAKIYPLPNPEEEEEDVPDLADEKLTADSVSAHGEAQEAQGP